DQARGGAAAFGGAKVNDGDPATYWSTDEGITKGAISLDWPPPVQIDRLVIQEAIALGQRVESWTIECKTDGAWVTLAHGTTIGHKRIATFPPVNTRQAPLITEKPGA